MGVLIRVFKLGQVFPAKDRLPNAIFRLCVLREDLLLEFKLLSQDDVGFKEERDGIMRKFG